MIITKTMMPVMDGFKQATQINKLKKLLKESDPMLPDIVILAI